MILEEETLIKYGYLPMDLLPHSHKLIRAACDECEKVRTTSKADYRALCISCARKGEKNGNCGKIQSDKTKALISKNHGGVKGQNHPMFGKQHSEETKALMSAAQKGEKHPNFDKRGAESSNYKGGKKLAIARKNAKRRKLGHIPIFHTKPDEDEHHFTNVFVGGIPKDVHNKLGGRRKKHRIRVLQWLKTRDKRKYELVICVLAKGPLKQKL